MIQFDVGRRRALGAHKMFKNAISNVAIAKKPPLTYIVGRPPEPYSTKMYQAIAGKMLFLTIKSVSGLP